MKPNENNEYQVYLEERNHIVVSEKETAQQFDKAILTLAAGALALSITFIHEIVPHPIEDTLCYLITAWILFCFSILSTLISFLTSQEACRRQREILDESISNKNVSAANVPAMWTNRLNYISIAFFILGIIFLIIFSAINLKKGGESMPGDKKEQAGYVPPKPPVQPGKVNEGYVPPKPPVKQPEKPNTSKK